MSQPRLTLGKASLLMIGLGSGALMGVPGFGHQAAPAGPIEGIVRADAGKPLEDIEVVLFDDDNLAMLEITRTDSRGRFAFGQEPARFHVYACPPALNPDDLVAGWAGERKRSVASGTEIQLYKGHWIDLEATDEAQRALAGVEVRVLDAGYPSPRVVQRLLTDAAGRARFLAPKQAHIGLFAADQRAAHWLTNLQPAAGDGQLHAVLPMGQALRGSVLGADGAPLAEAIVSLWSQDQEAWCGWSKSDAEGSFSMLAPAAGVLLRVIDPVGGHLPMQSLQQAQAYEGQQWSMRLGQQMQIQVDSSTKSPLARVFAWSEETQAWGWGVLTDESGAVRTSLAPHHSVVAIPLDADSAPQEAWNLQFNESSLQLHAPWADGN